MDKVFVNLICNDVDAARAFYTGLGYSIVEEYSSEMGICVRVSESFYIMSIKKEHLASFIGEARELGNPSTTLLSTIAFSLPTKEAVYEIAERAVASGGTMFGEVSEEYGMLTARVWDPSGNLLEYGCF